MANEGDQPATLNMVELEDARLNEFWTFVLTPVGARIGDTLGIAPHSSPLVKFDAPGGHPFVQKISSLKRSCAIVIAYKYFGHEEAKYRQSVDCHRLTLFIVSHDNDPVPVIVEKSGSE